MYVFQLAKELILNGHDCLILSISNDIDRYIYEGINVRYIPFEKNAYNELDNPSNLKPLIRIVEDFNPDIYHQHTLTPSLGLNHIKSISNLGIRTVFTSHVPSFTCIRGDLMLYGKVACNGELIHDRCMSCYLQKKKINNYLFRNIIILLSKIKILKHFHPVLNIFHSKVKLIKNFIRIPHQVVVVSTWQKIILEKLGFKNDKLSVCKQSIDSSYILERQKSNRPKKVRLGFIGRIVEEKGIFFLINIYSKYFKNNADLSVAAIKSSIDLNFYNTIKDLALINRVDWSENLELSEVIDFIDNIDLLVLPSTTLETGPYVIYEAFARKVPVLSFNKGGASELILNNINGWLVEDENSFIKKLTELIANPKLIRLASENIKNIRTTNDLYEDMYKIYNI